MHTHFHGAGRYDIHIHDDGYKKVLNKLDLLTTKIDHFMADTKAQFDALFERIDKATNDGAAAATAIGNRITGLEELVKNMGLPADQETAILARTEGVAAASENLASALTAMGKTPETPVPVPVPEPLPAVNQ